jgi:hypothetical protein
MWGVICRAKPQDQGFTEKRDPEPKVIQNFSTDLVRGHYLTSRHFMAENGRSHYKMDNPTAKRPEFPPHFWEGNSAS